RLSRLSRTPRAAASSAPASGGWLRRGAIALLILSGALTFGYAGASTYAASLLVYRAQLPLSGDPSQSGLTYTDITFPARGDGLQIKGWVIPGVLPSGRLTDDRILIVVHGTWRNRTDSAAGVLDLSVAFARHGFAVLALDLRGMGESPPAPLSMGYYEQRDVLGAVDFIQHGDWPYPELGRPRMIGGWGVSLGAATLLFAAAQEPAIRAVVSDCAYADIIPIFEREIPAQGGVPSLLTPGILAAAWAVYGVNFWAVRPVDVIARIAPRPILLIHGSADDYIPPANMGELYAAASAAPNAQVGEWLVPGAKHAQSYHVAGAAYVARVVGFFTAALGADQSGAA
ncbi:MAG TPA: alpha/beta fold hydrolase, partial [Ktedonobacterales bacterium]